MAKAWWLIVTLAGVYLMFLEIGMAVSESHALKGEGIIFFILGLGIGFSLFCLGLSKLRGKPKWIK